MLRQVVFAVLATLSLWSQEPVAAAKPADQHPPVQTSGKPNTLLDHDLLDPAYFGIDGALMVETKVADYLWVKPGFNFKGHTLKVVWEEPHLLAPNTDKLDLAVAARLTKILPQELSKAMAASLWPAAKVSST